MRRIRAIAACLVLAASAAGCTSSASPAAPPPTLTSSAPATPAPVSSTVATTPAPVTPTVPADVPTTGPNIKPGERPPVMPVAATKHTAAGAAAFAKFFIQTIDWAYATTSTTYMRHYFQPSCIACRSTADAVDKAKRDGHHFVGDRFKIRKVIPATSRGTELSATIHFDVESAEVVTASGAFVTGLPAYPDFKEHAFISWPRDGWTITEMIPSR